MSRLRPSFPWFRLAPLPTSGIGTIGASTDNAVARWDGVGGTTLKNSVVTIADVSGNMAGVGTLSSGAITSTGASSMGSLTLTTDLAVADGGTGLSSWTANSLVFASATTTLGSLGAATNGQIPIGSTGAAPVLATLTGTASQITITNAAGAITLATPQNIATTSTPQFLRLGLGQAADANHELAVTGSIFSSRVVDTDGATITLDWSAGNVHSVTLGGNRTIAFSNVADGMVLTFIVKQDATGSRLLTWPATVEWPGGTAPTLTTTPNRIDIFSFVRFAADTNEFGQTVGLNYS